MEWKEQGVSLTCDIKENIAHFNSLNKNVFNTKLTSGHFEMIFYKQIIWNVKKNKIKVLVWNV